ncbi:MAG: T9SS type A sorting domain-containing protein [Flavobacteriales bacterium]|nr:T9SS type A sorting domain-containing protein [Flavobacteriales bacterium]
MKKVISIFFSLLFGFMINAQLFVAETTPDANSFAENNEGITIFFSDILDGSTVDQNSVQVFGRWSGPMNGEIFISGVGNAFFFDPEEDFFHGEQVTVTLSNTILSITGEPLAKGFQFRFWTKVNPNTTYSQPQIIEMREDGEGLIQCYGAYAGDIDNNGYSDLVVINENANDIRTLLNDPIDGFSDFSTTILNTSNKPSTNEGTDFNRDGEIDLAIGSTQSNAVSVLYGNGSQLGNEILIQSGQGVRGLAVLDFNGDGWMDIATANRVASNIALIANDGAGGFEEAEFLDVLSCSGETGIVASDMNNDGLMDLVVACYNSDNVLVLINEGNGIFYEVDLSSVGSSPWMLVAGDVDGDGNVDIATANSGSGTASILFNDGTGELGTAVNYAAGGFPLAIDLGDLNGDDQLDLVVSNYASADFNIYSNNLGVFSEWFTLEVEQAGSCAIIHDHNNDGKADLTLIDEISDLLFIYTGDNPEGIEELSVYFNFFPNPTIGKINISGLSPEEEIRVWDPQGKFLRTISENGWHDISKLKPGSYLIESTVTGKSRKLIVQ